jgi:hypothetical protein
MTEPKFGVYDHAQKDWLSTHETLEEAERAFNDQDVKTAVVVPYGTPPEPPPDGEPNAPSPRVPERPDDNPPSFDLDPPRNE